MELPSDRPGWREHLIVMFADLCDYTSISEGSDVEEIGELRHALEALAGSVIQGHGGIITQVYGDGILAVFGYPVSYEDDARRAVEAALRLHYLVRAARWPEVAGAEVRLHTGIHAGWVLCREGDPVRGRYELTGDVVNTAARLSAAAGRDQIMVSDAVLAGIEGFFQLDLLEELPLKGKKQRVRAHRIVARSDACTRYEARTRQGLTPFVGRSAALATLRIAIQESRGGQLRLVAVTGVAGMGKTRLLEELRARVESDLLVLRGSCDSFVEMAPLEPFRQVVRQALHLHEAPAEGRLKQLERELAALGLSTCEGLTEAISALVSPFPVASAVVTVSTTAMPTPSALSRVLAALATSKTILLLLDDWQWADDSSRKVLDHVLNEQQKLSITVVVSARELRHVQPLPEGAVELALEPFQEEESAQVVLGLRPCELQLAVSRAIHRRAGGNPLFVEELCRSLPSHALADVDSLEHFDAPTTVQGAIKARIANLPETQRRVLCAAAVIGVEFSLTPLAWIIIDAALDQWLRELARTDLVYAVGAGTFRFKHGVTRDVVYESILLSERRRIHAVLARGYANQLSTDQTSSQTEALAYHYSGSGDNERAVEYAELAGDKAMQASALDRARHQYRVALRCLERLPPSSEAKRRWMRLSTHWAQAAVYSPAPGQVEALQRAAQFAQELGETGAQAQIHYMLGWMRYVLGDYQESMQRYKAALDLAQAASAERLVAQLWANVGQSYAAACQVDEALEHLNRGVDMKRMRGTSTCGTKVPQGFAYALGCRAAAFSYLGKFVEADQDLMLALPSVRGTGHPVDASVNALHAMVEIHRGSWIRCLDASRRGRMLAERGNSAYVIATSACYEHYASYKLSRSPAAARGLKLATDYLGDHGLKLFLSLGYALLAEVMLESGDELGAHDAIARCLTRVGEGDPLGEAMGQRVSARLHMHADRPAAAAEALDAALCSADRHGSRRERALTLLLRAELTCDPGELRAQESLLREALQDFERMGMTRETQLARDSLARLV